MRQKRTYFFFLATFFLAGAFLATFLTAFLVAFFANFFVTFFLGIMVSVLYVDGFKGNALKAARKITPTLTLFFLLSAPRADATQAIG